MQWSKFVEQLVKERALIDDSRVNRPMPVCMCVRARRLCVSPARTARLRPTLSRDVARPPCDCSCQVAID